MGVSISNPKVAPCFVTILSNLILANGMFFVFIVVYSKARLFKYNKTNNLENMKKSC
ncbi:hypothetical protein VCR26J2_670063 [Vibrio coralliirubri]|nr:hypothetical protein VCR6J2_250070 [Vibrio coralliirubri]CDT60507.1 hypothetical protein VCR1J2_660058 [Vibrio coralliirubri]CDT91707.1 hypothetical protein VCR26J2_670063 [Vibrio coralliirubri]CDU14424.1 hypothetical protein VCR17J2_640106 [Vibrio coralliirubri]